MAFADGWHAHSETHKSRDSSRSPLLNGPRAGVSFVVLDIACHPVSASTETIRNMLEDAEKISMPLAQGRDAHSEKDSQGVHQLSSV